MNLRPCAPDGSVARLQARRTAIDPAQCERRQTIRLLVYMMLRRRCPHHHSAISPFSPKTAPPSLVTKTALRGIFIDACRSPSAPFDADDSLTGTRFQFADRLEAIRSRLMAFGSQKH
jgi:hypothetical protein